MAEISLKRLEFRSTLGLYSPEKIAVNHFLMDLGFRFSHLLLTPFAKFISNAELIEPEPFFCDHH